MSHTSRFDLTNRVAIVTGSTSGIGKAIAAGFAQQGARVTLVGRTADKLEEALAEIRGLGGRSIGVRADVCINQEVEMMVQQTLAEFGRVDILVNTVGGGLRRSTLELTEEEWDNNMRWNLTSVFLCCKAAVKEMVKQGKGNIINISSVAAFYGNIRSAACYGAAKAGVINLTKTWAQEWAPYNIRVNAICPWVTNTPGQRDLSKDFQAVLEQQKSRVALHRLALAEDMVGAAIFLASDASSFITGQSIPVDGGLRYGFI